MNEAQTSDEQLDEEHAQALRMKRRLLWVLGTILVVLVLVLTPPLLNVNRLRHRITTSMSESLGRQVTIDNVELNLLPMPGFTLRNLVVSDDPSFSAEPVIRAMKVRATLRVSSLWRRQVEFSTVSFSADANGSAPSVNLVRRADGRWNFESILLHAAQRDAAPTTQRVAGPSPRFPYIEVSGARLNVKDGVEKLPLALTDADFALWLPSPRQWRLRLTGHPARTDTAVSDAGVVTAEATLERADRMSDVPIDATLQWKRAPLGEASRLMDAEDAGWRGTADTVVNLHGTLSEASFTAHLRLTDVRRADFIPVQRMEVAVDCTGHLNLVASVVREPACTLPLGATPAAGSMAATADTLTLAPFKATNLRLGMAEVPNAWLMNWARLISERMPETLSPSGSASGTVQQVAADATGDGAGWEGQFQTRITLRGSAAADGSAGAAGGGVTAAAGSVTPAERVVTVSPATGGDAWVLAPVNVAATDKAPPLMVSATVTKHGYTLQIDGAATAEQLRALAGMAPPLADGTSAWMPAASADGHGSDAPVRVDLTCTRVWGGEQTCLAGHAPEAPAKPVPRKRRRR